MKDLKTFNQLKESDKNITYVDLLNTVEWHKKRLEIIDRDKSICQKCKKKGHISIKNKFKSSCYSEYLYIEKLYNEVEISQYKSRYLNSAINEFSHLSPEFICDAFKNKDFSYKYINQNEYIILQVHHKYYIDNVLPWKYDDNVLITLCKKCHKKTHEDEEIKVYKNRELLHFSDLKMCPRCKGMGYLDEYHYYHSGICFMCIGNKFV